LENYEIATILAILIIINYKIILFYEVATSVVFFFAVGIPGSFEAL